MKKSGDSSSTGTEVSKGIQSSGKAYKKEEELINLYQKLYEETVQSNHLSPLEESRSLVCALGMPGYCAIDDENQIDMTQSEQVLQFNEIVKKQGQADLTIIVVRGIEGFTEYHLSTENGQINISKGYYQNTRWHTDRLTEDEWEEIYGESSDG